MEESKEKTALAGQDGDASVQEEPHMSPLKAYMRIFTYLSTKEILLECLATTAALVSGTTLALSNLIMGQLVTVLTQYMLGASTPDQFTNDVSKYCLYFVYAGLARWACVYLYTTLSTWTAYKAVRNLRRAFLRAALSQPMAYFDMNSSSVAAQAATNGQLVQSGSAEKLMICVQAVATLVAAFGIAFASQWKLTLILLCVAFALMGLISLVSSLEARIETRMLGVFAEAGAFAETVISTVRTVHAFGIRGVLMGHYEGYLESARVLGLKKSPLYGALFSVEYCLIFSSIGLAFWQGTTMIVNGEVHDLGPVITVILSVSVATLTFTIMAPHVISFQRAATAATQLFALIDKKSDIDPFDESGHKPAPGTTEGVISIENVSFSYPSRPGVTVLDDFSLHVPAGKVTALVGASGSGKSTIIGLLERWYRPTTGTITLDGTPIEALNLNWLRTHIRLVQQEPVLFSGTVFDNIAQGLVGTPWERAPRAEQRARVERAARLAFAHDFIVTRLPEGYDTHIGQRGGLLSGGQKQRVAIARSIVSEPKVLLLDEATSALDPHAEGVVQRALDNVSRSRTTVVIAHKLATVRRADNIVVMNKGRIVEQGTHEALVAAGGAYARMVAVQDLSVTDGGEDDDEEHGKKDYRQSKESSTVYGETVTPGDDDEPANDGEKDPGTHQLSLAETRECREIVASTERYNFETTKEPRLLLIVWQLIRENWELKWYFLVILIGSVFGSGTQPGQSILLARMMNIFDLPPAQMQSQGNFYALMFFVMGLGALVNYFIVGWLSNIVAQAMNTKFRRDLLSSLLRQDMQFFDRRENTVGALTGKVDASAQAMLELMSMNIILIFISVLSVVACSVLAVATQWKLGLVGVFAALSPLTAAGYVRIRLEVRMDRNTGRRFAASAAIASESVLAIRTVSSLAIEESVLERYTHELDEAIRQSVKPLLHQMVWFALTQAIEFFVLGLGYWWGCTLVRDGEITMYDFFVSFMGVFFAGREAGNVFNYTTSITKGKSAAHFYLWVKSLQPTVQETPENQSVVPSHQVDSIQLSDVRFNYPLRPEVRVLQDVNLDIKSGQFVALVGASGCGKSTMIALLERFYDPTSGTINIDGEPLAEMNPTAYRSHVALVQQEPTLYPSSIRENVLMGRPRQPKQENTVNTAEDDDDDRAVETALRAANAWDFVSSLPEGPHTPCGTNGSQLSGGQRQRIAIARALIRQPRVLLLDEATSALDTESERVVQQALARAAASSACVTVAVAHRLSTVRDADRICVFSGGRIVEEGTHGELWGLGGLYRQLCEAQSLDEGRGRGS